LKEEDEEKEEAVDLCEGDVGVENIALSPHDGEAHEHDADAGFDRHIGDDEEWFAEPPVLRMLVRGFQCRTSKYQIPSMRSEGHCGA